MSSSKPLSVLLALALLLAAPVAAWARTIDGPAAARAAADADPRAPDFCIGIQQRGDKYDGPCPVGAPTVPMYYMNKAFNQFRPQLHRQMRASGLRSVDTRGIEREMRRLDRLNASRGPDRIYDWAKDSPNPGRKDLLATCLVYGTLGAIISGIATLILSPGQLVWGTIIGAGSFCAEKVADPHLRRLLKRRGFNPE